MENTMYQQIKPPFEGMEAQCIKRLSDNAFIPIDESNGDYRAYQAWLADGNTPALADAVDPLPAVKAEAKQRLADTDWSQVADVAAVLVNKAAFDAYRATVRELYFNPVAEPVWPERPEADWSQA